MEMIQNKPIVWIANKVADRFTPILMTFSDLERRKCEESNFLADLSNYAHTVLPKTIISNKVTHMGEGVYFYGSTTSSHASHRSEAPASQNFCYTMFAMWLIFLSFVAAITDDFTYRLACDIN